MSKNARELLIMSRDKAEIFSQLHNKEVVKLYNKDRARKDIDEILSLYDEEFPKPFKKLNQITNTELIDLNKSVRSLIASHVWPCASRVVSSPYGMRYHPIFKQYKLHGGIDISAEQGTDIYAWNEGKVTAAGQDGGLGNYIEIAHGGGVTTRYAHCYELFVSAGGIVSGGQTIASVGSTGYSTAPHLHFEVAVNGKRVDPLAGYLKR